MPSTCRPAVKVCCIASVDESRMAIAAGASALGLVSAMPSGPGAIADELIATLAASVPPGIDTFLLTARRRAVDIVEQHRRCLTKTLQLVDAVPPDELQIVRDQLPGIRLVQVIHVMGEDSIDAALVVAPFVDALLLDSGNPALAIKQLGGTGRVHDWAISRRIVEQAIVPVWLAGGLTANNVVDAIDSVGPFGLDLCNGVRTRGALDAIKLTAFMSAVARSLMGRVRGDP